MLNPRSIRRPNVRHEQRFRNLNHHRRLDDVFLEISVVATEVVYVVYQVTSTHGNACARDDEPIGRLKANNGLLKYRTSLRAAVGVMEYA